jgi:hypothetical protein
MPLDLATATAQAFLPLVNTPFTLVSPGSGAALLLESVETRGAVQGFRVPFSLVFTLDKNVAQQQGTQRLSHALLGEFELFLVPIRGTATHARYEAVFG